MELLDPMRVHRRCKGTGVFQAASGPVSCSPCSGTGKILSARDQRRLDAETTRRYRLLKVMYARAEERDGCRAGDIDFQTHQGYGLLEQNERHRLDALFGSLAAGRIDDVIDALVAYGNAHTEREKK
ncbi:hypothetical protein OG883_42705 [Streptomyces sp. NBC_01142]|uniref:hypothetical protein n=1 Tax=Streptomyces sp. NBC_01142 TaxID=2975865 RepID=UPI00224F3877|nr:hypothetical protein [Streptomyces sp. NBC_01142]MCX4826355.1 hypothetical protein [Streptomyces sp. NBC_01142]